MNSVHRGRFGLVELGDQSAWGSFAQFVAAVSGAPVTIAGMDVSYDSPSLGQVQFGWHSPLRVAGAQVELHSYPRFLNLYCQAEFGARQYTIRHGDQCYTLDFDEVADQHSLQPR